MAVEMLKDHTSRGDNVEGFMMRYIQCQMVCETYSNSVFHTAYIPEKYAVKGLRIRLKKFGQLLWRVEEVYSRNAVEEDMVSAVRDAYRHHREVTDI